MEGCPGHVHTNPNTGAKTTYILDICIKRNLVWCIWFRFTHSHKYAKAIYFANYWLVGMRKPSPRCDFAAFLSIVVAKSTTTEHNGQACLYRRRQALVYPGRTQNLLSTRFRTKAFYTTLSRTERFHNLYEWSLEVWTDVVKTAKFILKHAIRLAIWARAVNRNMVVHLFGLEIFHLRLDPSSWHSWRQKVPVSVFHTRIHQTCRIQENPLCKTVSKYTVEPPVSDHPKCKVSVVA